MPNELVREAAAVLQPGFVGTVAPDWVLRWLGEGLGGVALFARNIESPAQVAALTAELRAERPDVIVAMDEEGGDVTRFESRSGSSRPGNLALGAIDDVALTEAVACDLGAELAAAGVTLNYAPDADVNSNPDNPVIGVRAFGAEPELVSRHTAAFVRGLQAAGVAACAKHFPGHGDTGVDSHLALPCIARNRDELGACELRPFRAAIQAGVQAIMTGHLLVQAYDESLPATLSPILVTDLLRGELGFTGLIVTDGIEMRAVRSRYGLAGAAVRALAAGADAICVGGDHADEQTAHHLRDAIVAAVHAGDLPAERLHDAATRVHSVAAWSAAQSRSGAATPPAAGGIVEKARNSGGPFKAVVGRGRRGGTLTGGIGLQAARRAVRVTVAEGAAGLPVGVAPHVVEFAAAPNVAVGAETPWGVPLGELLPGTTSVRFSAADLDGAADPVALVLAGAVGRPLVLAARDVHRHPWLVATLAAVLAARPDAIVVEMGLPVTVIGGVHIATYGATRANGVAAAELIAGTRVSATR